MTSEKEWKMIIQQIYKIPGCNNVVTVSAGLDLTILWGRKTVKVLKGK